MCLVVRLISVELVEDLEHQAAKWSARRWHRAAKLAGLVLRQALRDVLYRRPLEPFYEAKTSFGSIEASVVETRDIIRLRVYAISFGSRPLNPKGHLHRLLGRAFARETFVIYGVGRRLDLMPGIQVPWRHIPRNERGMIDRRTINGSAIDFASMNFMSSDYPADSTAASESAKYWAPNGSHDSSLDCSCDHHVEISTFEHDADICLARSQRPHGPGHPSRAKEADSGDVTGKRDHDVVENRIMVLMPARSGTFDIDSPIHTAANAPPPWMCALTSSPNTAAHTHGPSHPRPRPDGSPRVH